VIGFLLGIWAILLAETVKGRAFISIIRRGIMRLRIIVLFIALAILVG